MATMAAQAVFTLEQRRQTRAKSDTAVLLNALPSAILAVVLSLIVSRPLGVQLQARFTTEGDLGELQIRSIRRIPPSIITRLFQILLTGGSKTLTARSYKIETIN
jgi:hypothetical protein